MFYIHILRVKCEGMPQGDFLREASDPVSVIVRSLESKPTADGWERIRVAHRERRKLTKAASGLPWVERKLSLHHNLI